MYKQNCIRVIIEITRSMIGVNGGSLMMRELHIGDIVQHFKRETIENPATEYLYRIIAFAHHSETDEMLVVYEALYPPFKTCARPYDMFMS